MVPLPPSRLPSLSSSPPSPPSLSPSLSFLPVLRHPHHLSSSLSVPTVHQCRVVAPPFIMCTVSSVVSLSLAPSISPYKQRLIAVIVGLHGHLWVLLCHHPAIVMVGCPVSRCGVVSGGVKGGFMCLPCGPCYPGLLVCVMWQFCSHAVCGLLLMEWCWWIGGTSGGGRWQCRQCQQLWWCELSVVHVAAQIAS